jgi:predicted nucleic acid-binding protein
VQTNKSPARVVLDTNAALDWLLFADPRCAGLAHAVAGGGVCWLACLRMRDEFADVLARGLAERRGTAVAPLLAAWDRHATLVDAPAGQALVCTDPDDQVFIDLACAVGARWLVTRDAALLRLKRRAAALGVAIVPPAAWSSRA